MRKLITIVVFLCVCEALLWAEGAPALLFKRYDLEAGLPSNTVRAVIQDRSGLIWLGTGDGLCSFDGREVIRHTACTEGLSSYINCLATTPDGSLWAGTDDGVCSYEGEQYRTGSIVSGLASDSKGNLWASTRENGIFERLAESGEWKQFRSGSGWNCIYVDSSDRIFAAPFNREGILCEYDAASDSFKETTLDFSSAGEVRIEDIMEDGAGNLWLATWEEGLLYCAKGTNEVKTKTGKGTGFHHVHAIMEYDREALLVCSDDGLLWYDRFTSESKLYTGNGISDRFVYRAIKDAENGLWVATYYGGVSYAAPNSSQFERWDTSLMAGSKEKFLTSCICEDEDGTIWSGSDNGGLLHWNPQTGKAIRYYTGRALSSTNVHALLSDGRYLWIGEYTGGIERLDKSTGYIKGFLPRESVYSLFKDRNEVLWAGSMKDLYSYEPVSGGFVLRYEDTGLIYDICETPDGTLWFATDTKGVLRSRGTEWKYFPGDGTNPVYSLCCDSEGTLWAGTKNGLYRFEETTEEFERMNLKLARNVQYLCCESSDLWIATINGLVKYGIKDSSEQIYGKEDGLESAQFMTNSGMMSEDGKIYLGTNTGLDSFFPERIYKNAYIPPVIFTRFIVNEEENVLDRSDIRLRHNQDNVRISFAALSYCAAQKTSYEVKLSGKGEEEWRKTGNENWVEFTNLPAGRYRLDVKACNNDGVWNEEGANITFTIKPHPLASLPARFAYLIIIAVALFYLGLHIRKKAERKAKEELDTIMQERTADELKTRAKLVKTIAREVKIPLAMMAVPLEKIRNGEGTAGNLALVERSRLQLLEYAQAIQKSGGENDERTEEDLVSKMDAVIKKNISNPDFGVEDLARSLCVSRSGLFAKVKEASGCTPNQLILDARMKEAAKLLKEKGVSIAEVSYSVGFNSPSYFSKCFQTKFGMTPHEWTKTN